MTIRYIAEVTDPITGDVTTFDAQTAADLDALVDEHLESAYPGGDSAEPPPVALPLSAG